MEDKSLSVLSDCQLLSRYSAGGDQLAFAELVRRYQPMVLRVCRQVLAGCQHAEDTSQQVFVALSMKAAELVDRGTIASWLYRAAWNIASRTRRAACVRKAHEKSAASRMPMYAPRKKTEPDTLMILHEALSEIPDIYREAIVLHYFCGHTVAESAAKLSCPAGTVAARVSRGLERMRVILSDRSLVLGLLGLKLLLLEIGSKAAAAVPLPPLPPALPSKLPIAAARWGGNRMFRPKILRSAQAAGLLPIGLSLPAWAHFAPFARGAANATATTPFKAVGAGASSFFHIFSAQTKLKQAWLCLLLGLSCMGAGTAAAKVLAPQSWLAKLPETIVQSVHPTPPPPNPVYGTPMPGHKPEETEPHTYGITSQTAVPEPSSVGLLLAGGTIALRRRHRRS